MRHAFRAPIASIALLLILGPAQVQPALAAWTNQPAVNLPVSWTTGSITSHCIVSDGVGGAIAAWADTRNGGDIYAHRVLAAGTVDPAWPAQGRVVCNATGSQAAPTIVSDGAGGAIIAWVDTRTAGVNDIYAQRVLASGVPDPAWPSNGRAICTAASSQYEVAILSDGAGGAFIAWSDIRSGTNYDIYVHHVLGSGVVDPAWPVDGRLVVGAADHQVTSAIIGDGTGGILLAWQDFRSTTSYDIYAHHVLSSGAVDPVWPANGKALCTATGSQSGVRMATDGAGGAIVAWTDGRAGTDVYAHHVLANGTTDAYWAFDGNAVSTAASNQVVSSILEDGAGGAYIVWSDARSGVSYDIYMHRLTSTGTAEAGWAANGNPVCTSSGTQELAVLASDGGDGSLVCWSDVRGATRDVYMHRALATGSMDPTWPANGRAVCTATNNQYEPKIVADGASGAIASWYDFRNDNFNADMYAQRMGRHGYLGTPEPVISAVADVPNDQGGLVKLSWDASYLDTNADANLYAYDILRSVPTSVARSRIARGARVSADPSGSEPTRGDLLVTPTGLATVYWEYLTSKSALHYVSGYSYLAPTAADSTAGGNPATAFMVVGRNASSSMYWLSTPMSGYSVDDLAPAAPAPFAGQYAAGTTQLHWGANGEPDLAGYRLYRGGSAGFVPGPGNLVSAQPDTGYADPGPAGSWYKLSAIDAHGNESPFATLAPSGTVDAPATGGGALALSAPAPNPARTSATFAITLPRAMAIRLAVYDAGGRRVRVLRDGPAAAGDQAVRWDLLDDAGAAVGPGLYFARLEAGGRTLVRRMAAIR